MASLWQTRSSALASSAKRQSERCALPACAMVAPIRAPAGAASCSGAASTSLPCSVSRIGAPAARRSSIVARAGQQGLTGDSYLCLGVAQCFEKVEGRLEARIVIEPISASSLECMATGARTSFRLVYGTTLGAAIARDKAQLPEEFKDGKFCAQFVFRAEAAARTWLRPHAQDNLMDLVPVGKTRAGFNYSLDDKRVLNLENVVNDNDNIKQDISIDVYGRKTADDARAAAAATSTVKAEEEEEKEDELDALLTA